MALWKAGRGAQVIRLGGAIGSASDRFEAQVIRRRNSLKSLSQVPFEPCSNPFPHQAALKPSSPWSPLQALLKAPETLLKPPSSPAWSPLHPLEAPLLKPFWNPSEAPLKPFKPPSSPLRSLHLQAPFKPFSSPLKVPLKSFSSRLAGPRWSPLEAPLKPFSSPLEAPFKPLKASQRWSPLQAPLKPPLQAPLQAFWRWRVLFVSVFGSFLDMCWAHSTRSPCPVFTLRFIFSVTTCGVIAGLRIARDMWEFIMSWFPHSAVLHFLTSVAFLTSPVWRSLLCSLFVFFSPYQSSHDAKPLSHNCADEPFSPHYCFWFLFVCVFLVWVAFV